VGRQGAGKGDLKMQTSWEVAILASGHLRRGVPIGGVRTVGATQDEKRGMRLQFTSASCFVTGVQPEAILGRPFNPKTSGEKKNQKKKKTTTDEKGINYKAS